MSSIAPALGESYSLTELPRIPDLPLAGRVVVPESQKSKEYNSTDTIDLGISKLIVSSYVLKPTPKLVWSFPLSPNTLVDAMDVRENLYSIAVTERKKSKLLLIQRAENDSTSEEVPLGRPATGVKFAGPKSIYVLLNNGEFVVYKYTQDPLSAPAKVDLYNLPSCSSRDTKVLFHSFILNHLFKHKNDLLFYIVASAKSVTYRLIALEEEKTFEIFQISGAAPSKGIYAYSDGILSHLDTTTHTLSTSSLMKPQEIIKLFSLTNLIGEPDAESLYALTAVAADRLLVSFKSLVMLINVKFESLLSEHTNHSGNRVYLCFTLPVVGNSAQTRNSFALYLNLEDKTKTCKLKLIQVDVGLNHLIESLGKSLHAVNAKPEWNGLPHIDDEDLEAARDANLKQLQKVFKTLSKYRSKGNAKDFNKHTVDFLTAGTNSSVLKYTHGRDRVVDDKFIKLLLSLIFEFDDAKAVQIIDEKFLPETALTYLLSHPLFPKEYTRGLLILLSALDQPQLLKQAIDNCPAVDLDELMTEFLNLTEVSEEVEHDGDQGEFVMQFLRATIDRMVKDNSIALITSKLLETLNSEYEGANKKLERMLNVLININSNNSWAVVLAVIDVGGLFNWNMPTLQALSDVIDSKVEALTQNSYNLTLTNQCLLGVEQKSKKDKKKNTSRVVDNIHEITSQRLQLDAILTMNNSSNNRRLKADEGIELAKQIPTYSRERLVL